MFFCSVASRSSGHWACRSAIASRSNVRMFSCSDVQGSIASRSIVQCFVFKRPLSLSKCNSFAFNCSNVLLFGCSRFNCFAFKVQLLRVQGSIASRSDVQMCSCSIVLLFSFNFSRGFTQSETLNCVNGRVEWIMGCGLKANHWCNVLLMMQSRSFRRILYKLYDARCLSFATNIQKIDALTSQVCRYLWKVFFLFRQ